MVVRGTERASHDTVLVPVDVEDPGEAMLNFAFAFAFAEAAARSVPLRAVHASGRSPTLCCTMPTAPSPWFPASERAT
jgi:hypothetical protein